MDTLDFNWCLRKLYQALLDAFPEEAVKKNGELCPGGDLRQKENAWVRTAYDAAGLQKVLRETRMRLVIRKLVKKKKLCISIASNSDEF